MYTSVLCCYNRSPANAASRCQSAKVRQLARPWYFACLAERLQADVLNWTGMVNMGFGRCVVTTVVVSVVLCLPTNGLLAQGAPHSATATRTVGSAPSIDGVLDDAGWGEAIPIVDFSQKVPLEGAEPSVSTEVRLLYDENALYVGARMYHPDPASIRTTLTRRDGDSDAERLVIFLDTFHDRRTAYSFGVSAAGVRFDTYYPEDNEKGEAQFDPVWTTRVNVDAQGWTAEMRIPFTQLRFNAADPQVWGLEITRFIPERNEEIQWVLIPRE